MFFFINYVHFFTELKSKKRHLTHDEILSVDENSSNCKDNKIVSVNDQITSRCYVDLKNGDYALQKKCLDSKQIEIKTSTAYAEPELSTLNNDTSVKLELPIQADEGFSALNGCIDNGTVSESESHANAEEDVTEINISRRVDPGTTLVRNMVTGKLTAVGGEQLPWFDDIKVCLVDGKKAYRCGVCKKFFKWRSNLNRHMNVHTRAKVYKCNVCGKIFIQENYLERHMKVHSNEKQIQCPVCNKQFFYPAALVHHMERSHPDHKTLSCNICSEKFFGEWDLKKHVEIHITKVKHQCSQCNETFKHKSKLQKHIFQVHENNQFKCKQCDERFDTKPALREHSKTHWKNIYKCSECSKEFNHVSNLNTHVRLHRNEQFFDCDICGNVFRRKGNMQRHRTTHFNNHATIATNTSEATFSSIYNEGKACDFTCVICQRPFANSTELSVHATYCTSSTST